MGRHNKIRVLSGGWWRKESRPPPAKLFYAYPDLPEESRAFLERCGLIQFPSHVHAARPSWSIHDNPETMTIPGFPHEPPLGPPSCTEDAQGFLYAASLLQCFRNMLMLRCQASSLSGSCHRSAVLHSCLSVTNHNTTHNTTHNHNT